MKVVFDIDGTLTNYYGFIRKEAIPFIEKYGLKVINQNALEIEDIFDIENQLKSSGISDVEATAKKNWILKRFWVGYRFIKYSLLLSFRPGVKECVSKLKNNGAIIEIHTSRGLKNASSFVTKVCQIMTKIQLRLNGVQVDSIFFYQSDKDKIKNIIAGDADLFFDDKETVINSLVDAGKKVICVSEKYNSDLNESENLKFIDEFEWSSLHKQMELLFGRNKLDCMLREAKSKKYFNRLLWITNIVFLKYNVHILNKEKLVENHNGKGIIYAPNHVKTLDPIIIQSVLKSHVHWVALKRFFDGEDSIFNNSKSKLLCRITKECFERLELIPVERLSDNPDAVNYSSLKDMYTFLRLGCSIGIFAEGTTRKEEGREFGVFDDGFITLASKTGSVVQPISIYWKDDKNIIINIGQAFCVDKNGREEAYRLFCDMQKRMLSESKHLDVHIPYY